MRFAFRPRQLNTYGGCDSETHPENPGYTQSKYHEVAKSCPKENGI